ncbi:EamA family transporter [Niallia oryzisoli]|uniref:EamA family transporter n=1 Tax=Niallia oryzisoli TaxID=1737571 RepID=A0ABZ2CLE7_9BACI
MSVTLALFAALFAALTSILAKIGMENVNSNLATAIRTVIVLVMSYIVVFITGQLDTISSISPKAMAYIVLSGLATGLSWLFFFQALAMGDVSKVVPIDKSSIVLTILLSIVVLGEKPVPKIIAGGALIAIGTFVLIGKNEENKRFTGSQIYIVYAIIGAVFAALTSILAKIGMEGVDSMLRHF